MDWSQFDSMLDTETMDKLKELENGGAIIPPGKYEVVPEKIELTTSKNNNPMTVIRFRIVAGPMKKNLIFANFVMKSAFGIHNVKELIKGLKPTEPVTFASFGQWNQYLGDLSDERTCKYSYVLEYGESPNKNDPSNPYKTYKIIDGPFEVPADYQPPKPKEDNWQ